VVKALACTHKALGSIPNIGVGGWVCVWEGIYLKEFLKRAKNQYQTKIKLTKGKNKIKSRKTNKLSSTLIQKTEKFIFHQDCKLENRIY
jgi:hypothetical protein